MANEDIDRAADTPALADMLTKFPSSWHQEPLTKLLPHQVEEFFARENAPTLRLESPESVSERDLYTHPAPHRANNTFSVATQNTKAAAVPPTFAHHYAASAPICRHCGRRFARKSEMQCHLAQAHSNKNEVAAPTRYPIRQPTQTMSTAAASDGELSPLDNNPALVCNV